MKGGYSRLLGRAVAGVLAAVGLLVLLYGANAQNRKPASEDSAHGLVFEKLGF